RGVDEIALAGAFEEGGRVVAVLPEGLGKASVAAKYRDGIRQERLVLVSPYAPHAGFTVGNAMGRNRLIYALADAALVVASALRTGGTWAGAEEELKREDARRVYVRVAPVAGNEGLLAIGGVPFPDEALRRGIRVLLGEVTAMKIAGAVEPQATEYDAVLPLILELLAQPRTAKELAAALGVAPAQAKKWIDRAIAEKRVVRRGKPVKLHRADALQPSLFG
ncbi:MAG: DNA-processing protein DprA, partial [Thermoanaerobaculia bacterium]